MLHVETALHGIHEDVVQSGDGIGLQQFQHQGAGLLKQLVVVPGIGGEGLESMAHIHVAFAQYADLFLNQGHSAAGGVGDMQVIQQVGVALQEIVVVLQILAHDLIVE